MNNYMKNYPFINTSASIPIVAWKLMKNRSHISSDIFIPGCSSHSGNSQGFKLAAESPNMSAKDIELLYCLIGKTIIYKQSCCIKRTRMYYIHTHKDGIINKL